MRPVGSSLTSVIVRFDDVTAAQMAVQGSNRGWTSRISGRCWLWKFESGGDGMARTATRLQLLSRLPRLAMTMGAVTGGSQVQPGLGLEPLGSSRRCLTVAGWMQVTRPRWDPTPTPHAQAADARSCPMTSDQRPGRGCMHILCQRCVCFHPNSALLAACVTVSSATEEPLGACVQLLGPLPAFLQHLPANCCRADLSLYRRRYTAITEAR